MPKDIFEGTEISPSAWLAEGKREGGNVVFQYYKNNNTDVLGKHGFDLASENASTGGAHTFMAPDVGDDEASYLLTVVVLVNDIQIDTAEDGEYRVWPRTVTVESFLEDGTSSPFFPFSVVQEGEAEMHASTDRFGRKRVQLKLGKAFEIKEQPPFLMKSLASSGRKWKVQVDPHFKAEILSRKDKGRKQYVNLLSASKHANIEADALGSSVTVIVGLKNSEGPNKACIYVKVRFTHADGAAGRSPRNNPKQDVNFLNGQVEKVGQTEMDENVVSGWISVDKAEPVKLTIDLGLAGGDRCVVEVGSTPTRVDDTVEFVNWRRIYYELLAIDFKKYVDLPQATRAHLKATGEKVFVEYLLSNVVSLPRADAVKHSVLPRSFAEKKNGPADVHIVTPEILLRNRFTLDKSPHQIAFAVGDGVFTNSAEDEPKKVRLPHPAERRFAPLSLGSKVFWIPRTDESCPDNLEITWKAVVPKARAWVPAKLEWADTEIIDEDEAKSKKKDERVIVLTCTHDGATLPVTFEKDWGFLPTSVPSRERKAIIKFMSTWTKDKVGDKVTFKLTAKGPGGVLSDNQNKRVNDIKKEVQSAFNDIGAGRKHPGIGDEGEPRTGTLGIDSVDFTQTTWHKIVVDLKAKDGYPSGLYGALSDTKCPIDLEFNFRAQHIAAGFVLGDYPRGGLSVDATDKHLALTVLHEIGHKMAMTPHKLAADAHSPGLREAKTVDDSDEGKHKHPAGSSKGHYYIEHGHTGNHCAYGLTDEQKKVDLYDTFHSSATCLMFGLKDQGDGSGRQHFCPQCIEYIRARDLRDVR